MAVLKRNDPHGDVRSPILKKTHDSSKRTAHSVKRLLEAVMYVTFDEKGFGSHLVRVKCWYSTGQARCFLQIPVFMLN